VKTQTRDLDDEDLDPLEVVEAVLNDDDRFEWEYDPDGDVQFCCDSPIGLVAGYFAFRPELPALMLTVTFDLHATPEQYLDAIRLAAKINENLWFGHFDVWSNDGDIIFRHSMTLIGRPTVTQGEVLAALAATLDAANRFHPAFYLLLRQNKSVETAHTIAFIDPVGSA
jgi:hypothetical protein